MQKTNLKKEIYIEKTNFIAENCTFFHINKDNDIVMCLLKQILLNPAPLKDCDGYLDLMEEIKSRRVGIIRNMTYSYTIEAIFKVVYMIRSQISSPERITQQTEQIRQYMKYVNEKDTGKMYYSQQKVIKISDEDLNKINTKKRRA